MGMQGAGRIITAFRVLNSAASWIWVNMVIIRLPKSSLAMHTAGIGDTFVLVWLPFKLAKPGFQYAHVSKVLAKD